MPRFGVAAIAILSASVAAGATKPADISWGKAGVDYDQYRRDSIACGISGATRDMSGQQSYQEAMHGTRLQDSVLDGGGETGDKLQDYALIQRRTMQRQVPKLQHYLVNGVERCLIDKGYVPFALNGGQARALSKLHRGTERRFRYLYALASDGALLAKQRVDMGPR